MNDTLPPGTPTPSASASSRHRLIAFLGLDEGWQRIVLMGLLVVVLTLIIIPKGQFFLPDYDPGDVARRVGLGLLARVQQNDLSPAGLHPAGGHHGEPLEPGGVGGQAAGGRGQVRPAAAKGRSTSTASRWGRCPSPRRQRFDRGVL